MKTFSVNLISDLIRELVLCIFFVYIFWLTNKIISIYLCLFIFGVIGFIISIIILAISTNLPCENNNICLITYNNQTYFDNFYEFEESFENKFKNIIILISIVIVECAYNCFLYYSANLTPITFPIYKVIVDFCHNIYFTFKTDADKPLDGMIKIYPAFCIIELFFLLIYNEVIEINLCGLEHNTKKNIISRCQTESTEKLNQIELSRVESERFSSVFLIN
jgi:hypothetical protein